MHFNASFHIIYPQPEDWSDNFITAFKNAIKIALDENNIFTVTTRLHVNTLLEFIKS